MKTLHRALHAIRRGAMGHKDPKWAFFDTIGICHNLERWLREYVSDLDLRYDLIAHAGNLMEKWEKEHHIEGRRYANSTSRTYPVGGHREYDTGDLWANPRRWALLAYLLEQTR